MQYDIRENFQGGMIKSRPTCQVGLCEEPSLSIIESIDGKGKVFVCGGHLLSLDKKRKELQNKITAKAIEQLKADGEW